MRKNLIIVLGALGTGLLAVVFWMLQPQFEHFRARYEERQRQVTLEEKLQALASSVMVASREDERAVHKKAKEVKDFIRLTWSNQEDRVRALLKMESSLCNIDTTQLLLKHGPSPVLRIYELLGETMNGFDGIENEDVHVWKMQIRALERIKKDCDYAQGLLDAEPADSKNLRELKDLVSSLRGTYDHYLVTHEMIFYSTESAKELPIEKAREIHAYFEHSLGRPLRTRQQIFDDYDRRRPKTPTDDDVKIDLDL